MRGLQALSLEIRLLRERIKGIVEQGEVWDLTADGSQLRPESMAALCTLS